MNDVIPDDEAGSLELLNDEFAARLDRLDRSVERIETKATVVVGFAAAAAPFLATQNTNALFALVAYASYAAAFGFGLVAVAPATYKELEPRPLLDEFGTAPAVLTLRSLVAGRVHIFEAGVRHRRHKTLCWWISLATLAYGLLFSIIAMMQTQ